MIKLPLVRSGMSVDHYRYATRAHSPEESKAIVNLAVSHAKSEASKRKESWIGQA